MKSFIVILFIAWVLWMVMPLMGMVMGALLLLSWGWVKFVN